MAGYLRAGDVVADNFEIVRELGRGAMGVVFLAMDRSLERDVALKLMHPSYEVERDAQHVQRFLREARAVAKLRGEHVVQIYEANTHDGVPYIVMEPLSGEGLDQELARAKRLPVAQSVNYILQACAALSEAHARLIVHRDLKPANLFLHRPTPGRLCLKVLDFGIAKLSFEALRITLTGQVIGTPLYMSPEQRISPDRIDQRTDIWSLGVVLYQALTGRVPFLANSGPKLHDYILSATPEPPERIVPTLPPELTRVLLCCLEKDPAARYQNVGELAWALAPFAGEVGRQLACEVSAFLELEPLPPSVISVPASLPRARVIPFEGAPPASSGRVQPVEPIGFGRERPVDQELSDEETLVQAVVNRMRDGRRIVFLLGSGLTAPYQGRPGVPHVQGMIQLVRECYRPRDREGFERALAATRPDGRYQAAFARLLATHGVKEVNRTIRRAVLQARLKQDERESAALAGHRDACLWLERDLTGWHLSPALEALGTLLTRADAQSRPLVLTSNFDPLIEVAILHAGGRPFRTVLHGDGELRSLEDDGCHIVHFHGDWWRTDTLHTPASLSQDRPKLTSALARLLRERTLVVLGYGGWDDVFARSLVDVVRSGDLVGHGEDGLDVLWAFFSPDRDCILRRYDALFSSLAEGIARGRILFYKGANLHNVLPAVEAALGSHSMAEAHPEPSGAPIVGTLLSAQDEFAGPKVGDSETRPRENAPTNDDANTVRRG